MQSFIFLFQNHIYLFPIWHSLTSVIYILYYSCALIFQCHRTDWYDLWQCILKGKSTDFENTYQNLKFFEDIKNMWIKILRSFPIKSYEHIFGIKVNPSSFLGGATFLVSYFSPPLFCNFFMNWGLFLHFWGVGSILSLALEKKFCCPPKINK